MPDPRLLTEEALANVHSFIATARIMGYFETTAVLYGLLGHIAALSEQRDEAAKALRDFEEHGLRCDLNPTMQFGDETRLYGTMCGYLRRADKRVRERAAAALSRFAAEGTAG